MDSVAVIALYTIPGTGVPAFGCAYRPDGRPLKMALAADLAPPLLAKASAFFEWLESQPPGAIFSPSNNGRGATVSVPSAVEFGFEVMDRGSMLAPLDQADAETWLHWAFATTREATLDEQVSDFGGATVADFEGLG